MEGSLSRNGAHLLVGGRKGHVAGVLGYVQWTQLTLPSDHSYFSTMGGEVIMQPNPKMTQFVGAKRSVLDVCSV